MKELFIECNMGIAGDMLMSSLCELIPDSDEFVKRLNEAGIPEVNVIKESAVKCGITGTHIRVFIDGEEESEESRDHHHHHRYAYRSEHHHHHHHNSLGDISTLIDSLNVSDWVKENAKAVYKIIAEAESIAHGKEITEIHFHEVGTADAVADIVGCCMLMEEIGADKITASPIRTGFGRVRCAHGFLPVPTPATAHILREIPQYAGNIEGELCTPTGAALLKHFAGNFGRMLPMRVEKIGYGMGTKDFPVANCVRAFLGESETDYKTDKVLEVVCNIDDMTGEDMAFAFERIFEAGALDVCTIPCGMKKSRPGIILFCICKEENRESVVKAVFKHTSTIGIRVKTCERYVLDRRVETAETELGSVRVKISESGEIKKVKAEYDDLEKIARNNNISISDARKKV